MEQVILRSCWIRYGIWNFHPLVQAQQVHLMEVLLAITGKDFVVTCSDSACVRSIVVLKRGHDKTKQLTNHSLMVYSGDAGDVCQFTEYVDKNCKLYSMQHGYDMSVDQCATFVRKELAASLRSRVSLSFA